MGVWSSISFRNFDKRRIRRGFSPSSRNSYVKQILNIDSDSFTTTVLQDVQEIRIQESNFENSVQPTSNYEKKESFDCPTYFEYSMGGNVKFYKEHLQHDFELENKINSVKKSGRRLRKSSHSDNDSEPESQRYVDKPQEKVIPVVNTISEEPELSFDDYSSIYQPEFMLNINSQSLVKEMPKNALEEKVSNEETANKRRKDKNRIAGWSEDLMEISSPENLRNEEVHVVNKTEILPTLKENTVHPNQIDVLHYHSSSVKTKKNSKQLENQEIKSKEHKNIGNQEMKTVKRDKNKIGNKNNTTNVKPQQPKKLIQSSKSNVKEAKNILSKEKSPQLKQKQDIHDHSASPLTKAENRNETKDRTKKPERKEKSRELIQPKEFDNEKHTQHSKDYKTPDSFLSLLNMDTTTIFDNIDLFEELGTAEKTFSEPTKKDIEFYPESPISEVHFFKTPCSTRHNSLETFEQLENECIEDSSKQEPEKPQDDTLTSNLPPNYKKLPKEFQEMARRLTRKDSPKKSSPSLYQVNSSQNFNCSSSTCSTMSLRSPSGRTLFRTPSYKMPKTPSLSRQHPSTYVTQHTSSRSRPSSRASSRATSPTREHIEALL